MANLQLHHVSISFGYRDLIKQANLTISEGVRIALVGDNGSGKTTLLKIAGGLIKPDSGRAILQRGARVSYLPQTGISLSGRSLREESEKAFEYFEEIEREKGQLESDLETIDPQSPKIDTTLQRQHELQETLIEGGYYDRDSRVDRVLRGLGFSDADFLRLTDEFSGGWQMRIALAKVLLEQPDIMLLDEPTNYLDLEARTWLREYLALFHGGLIVVSHDRDFLDSAVSSVLEIFNGALTTYTGNYTQYVEIRKKALATQIAAYSAQQEEIEKIESFVRRFRANASKATQVKSRVNYLERMAKIELPESVKTIHFSFPKPPHSGRRVLSLETISKAYGETLVLREISLAIERGEKLVVTGKNGAGKTTLLRILGGIDRGYRGNMKYGTDVRIGYFSQDIDAVVSSRSLIEEIEDVAPTELIPRLRNMLGAFLFRGDDIYKSTSVLSGGERNRLALLKLLVRSVNLLVLDEPTNHLDMGSKEVLLRALSHFDGTIVFVSHDRYFIEKLATRVLELSETGWRVFPGDYEYYQWRLGRETELDDSDNNPWEGAVKGKQHSPGNSGAGRNKELSRRLRKSEREEEALLADIERLEKEHRDIQDALSEPEVYRDGERVRELKRELKANEERQEKLSERWRDVEGTLVSIRKELEIYGK